MRKTWQRSFLGVLIGCIGLTPGCATPPPCSPTEALPVSAPQAPAYDGIGLIARLKAAKAQQAYTTTAPDSG